MFVVMLCGEFQIPPTKLTTSRTSPPHQQNTVEVDSNTQEKQHSSSVSPTLSILILYHREQTEESMEWGDSDSLVQN
jgi:hypothetical protein